VHALTNARIVPAPGEVIEAGTVVIRDGNVVDVGARVRPPADARVWDMSGKMIYAGFVDLSTDHGMSKGKKRGPGSHPPGDEQGQDETAVVGSPYWNRKISPQISGANIFKPDAEAAKTLRGQGITLVMTVPPGGVIGGTGALVTTGDGAANDLVVESDVVLGVRFPQRRRGDDTYPNSLMGILTLLRQSFLDADWYLRATAAWERDPSFERPEANDALERLSELRAARIPLLMFTKDDKAFLRSSRLATEIGLPAIVRGSNYEYRRIDAVKRTGLPLLLPLDFPESPSVKSADEALQVGLEEMRHWYLAPENAMTVHGAGVEFSFTSDGLKDKGEFLSAIRKVVKRGLPVDAALAALTTAPAEIIGRTDRFGTVASGKAANLVITDGDLFEKETKIVETWVDGNRYVVNAEPEVDVRGIWNVTLAGSKASDDKVTLTLEDDRAKPSGKMSMAQEVDIKNVDLSGALLSFTVEGESLGKPGVVQMSAVAEEEQLIGHGVWADGSRFTWRATKTAPWEEKPDATEKKDRERLHLTPRYPGGAFGLEGIPAQPKVIAFAGATIWTSASQGILEDAALLVAEGKIVGVGSGVKVPKDAVVVDVTGMHITPGLIDCHSHTAIEGGVNEGTQTITAEVRIGDVVDPTDISIYRQLAGGLTAANLLHGSANAIGGQNQVIKLRWGATAEEMKFEGAPAGIKFALGENPKQSNWGDDNVTRYPQTRMGVEQIIRDGFQAATDYRSEWERYDRTREGMPPRRDLELEALVEIMRGDRLVHSHSYRQDEILMLTRIAEDFGFTIGSFQHVLEGYKVADRLAEHGAGASAFADWWAYKFEVYDAIPYNGALMHDQDVVVSFNSDSDELARHLNTEAAKAVKYGGVPPAEALKFVTLNPAKQLHIDHRVGSLEPGKDADFVVWNGDPLSTLTACEQTWIDGRKYFDRDEDLARRKQVREERAELIQYLLKEDDGGKKKDGEKKKNGGHHKGPRPQYSCKGIIERGADHEDR
jgi:imidazolonepropionase-like amidohydrolase